MSKVDVTRYGFVGTYPPTVCGLATFTASLRGALLHGSRDTGDVVRLVDAPEARPSSEVVAQLPPADPVALDNATRCLNACDFVVVQHEYGIYGGADGDEVIGLLDRLRVPSIVVLHTVLSAPTAHQRSVLEAVVERAHRVVVMTRAALDRLVAGYRVAPDKIHVIPHGAPDMSGPTHSVTFRPGRFVALTWGLLGPGKGIEWAIDAMALLRDDARTPDYIVAGRTHPRVVEHSGEVYRDALLAQVRRLRLQTSVTFDARYRGPESLAELVRSADVVILPYDSTEQVTSGVLTEAVAAGRPVIATTFPHARELLAGGGGILVDHGDPRAIADAVRTLMSEHTVVDRPPDSQGSLLWSAVARQYRRLALDLVPVPAGA